MTWARFRLFVMRVSVTVSAFVCGVEASLERYDVAAPWGLLALLSLIILLGDGDGP